MGNNVRNLNFNCEGLLDEVENLLQLARGGVNCYSESVKEDCNSGAKQEVCIANNWYFLSWGFFRWIYKIKYKN